MPYKRRPCPLCGELMDGRSQACRACRPSYERSSEHRAAMSDRVKGVPKPSATGRKRPDHAAWMREQFWTPDRRAAARKT